MSFTTTRPTLSAAAPSRARTAVRWMASLLGYPLGGVVAMTLIGPVDGLGSALAGGFLTGLVIGMAQAWAMRAGRPLAALWTLASAIGLAVGLAVGSHVVGFSTGLTALVVQGALSGVFVGLAQAVVLRTTMAGGVGRREGDRGRIGAAGPAYLVIAWPLYLAVVWAAGWTVTTAIGVRVDEQFTVFGSAGAVTAAALTVVLPLILQSRRTTEGQAR